jgi:hypothetical protein
VRCTLSAAQYDAQDCCRDGYIALHVLQKSGARQLAGRTSNSSSSSCLVPQTCPILLATSRRSVSEQGGHSSQPQGQAGRSRSRAVAPERSVFAPSTHETDAADGGAHRQAAVTAAELVRLSRCTHFMLHANATMQWTNHRCGPASVRRLFVWQCVLFRHPCDSIGGHPGCLFPTSDVAAGIL